MTTNLDRARLVSSKVQLLSVVLHKAVLGTNLDPLDVPNRLDLGQKHRARYEFGPHGSDTLRVLVDFEFSAKPKTNAEEAENLVGLKATFMVIYKLPAPTTFPPDSLEHFAWLNGCYNAWPYWRELVQSVSGRVGLASISVPVFRPPVAPVDEKGKLMPPTKKALPRRSKRG